MLYQRRHRKTLNQLAIGCMLVMTSVASGGDNVTDAFSRDFSVYNAAFDDVASDAFSREFSVNNATFDDVASDAFSREFSVYNVDFTDLFSDAFTREFSVYNDDFLSGVTGAFSREFSVLLPELVLDIDANPVNGGQVLPEMCYVELAEGEIVDIEARPFPGFNFSNWSPAELVDDPLSPCTSITVNDNITLTANFVENGLPIITSWSGAGDGFSYSDPANWCPAIVPNELLPQDSFYAVIDGTTSAVLLDISPTVTLMDLTNDASLTVSQTTGSQALTVNDTITSSGRLRTFDAAQFTINADINQTGGGRIEVNDDAVMALVGGAVNGGVVAAQGNGVIDLAGAATLTDVAVSGLSIPDGTSINLDGMIVNVDTIEVLAGAAPTGIGVLNDLTITAETPEAAELVLNSESLAFLGTAGQSITNEVGHAIRGAGTINGAALINRGIIEAVETAQGGASPQSLTLAPTITTNEADLRAFGQGFSLHLNGTVDQTANGLILAGEAGTVQINADVTGAGDMIAGGGAVLVNGAVSVTFDRAELWYDSVLETHGAFVVDEPAQVQVLDMLTATCDAGFALGGCLPPPPPKIQFDIRGLLDAVGGVQLVVPVIGTELPNTGTLRMAGNFVNEVRGFAAEFFHWQAGAVQLYGTPQTFEVAGQDRGAEPCGYIDNFAIGTFELIDNAVVNIVDVFDNQEDGNATCDEALYVDTLILGAGATLNTDGCRVYYRTLIDNGGAIPGLGADVLLASDPAPLRVLSILAHGDPAEEHATDLLARNGVEPRFGGIERLRFEMNTLLNQETVTQENVQITCAGATVPIMESFAIVDASSFDITLAGPIAHRDCCVFSFDGMQTACNDLVQVATPVMSLWGDIDGSGGVSGGDLSLIKPWFGYAVGDMVNDEPVQPQFDFDRNGVITGGDFVAIKPFLNHFGAECP